MLSLCNSEIDSACYATESFEFDNPSNSMIYPGKEVVIFPPPWCSSYWKGSLWVTNFPFFFFLSQINLFEINHIW